jgi:hypothetical protein
MPAAKQPPHAISDTPAVDAFMAALDHPLKAEAQAVRAIIKSVHPGITEQVKWAAPSFSYKGYLVTFNLRMTDRLHLVFHDGAILNNEGGLLEGDYPDRRMMYFSGMDDVKAKQAALESIIREWIVIKDGSE